MARGCRPSSSQLSVKLADVGPPVVCVVGSQSSSGSFELRQVQEEVLGRRGISSGGWPQKRAARVDQLRRGRASGRSCRTGRRARSA